MTENPPAAPFPYFGGKSRIAREVWSRLGSTRCYVEPFFGSGAVLLARPGEIRGREVVNDVDGMIANFWRAVRSAPEAVAEHADHPVNENDLHARNAWLKARRDSLQPALEAAPDWCDPKTAGWWVWGMSCWIGGGWAAKPHRSMPKIGSPNGVHALSRRDRLPDVFAALSRRLRHVYVVSGDWSRALGRSTLHGGTNGGPTAVFFDPPYSHAIREPGLYVHDSASVAQDVHSWCRERGDDPRLRIALCGYAGEHDALERFGWTVRAWKAAGGYGNQGSGRGRTNARLERIWYSPHCLAAADTTAAA